jgi:FKBP-type peptidyl-prolyl cis-trans isomerase SlyD
MVELSISPHEAYGERIADAVRIVPRRMFPGGPTPETGSLYRATDADGHITFFTVIDVTADSVVVDTNHPLAGQTLEVLVQVISVMETDRAAATC